MTDKKTRTFDKTEMGLWFDGALGHEYLRERLACVVEYFGGDASLVESLNGPMPDDAWDEDDALEYVNGHGVDVYLAFVDGDIMCLAS